MNKFYSLAKQAIAVVVGYLFTTIGRYYFSKLVYSSSMMVFSNFSVRLTINIIRIYSIVYPIGFIQVLLAYAVGIQPKQDCI